MLITLWHNTSPMDFAQLRTQVFERYGQGDFAGALALLDAAGDIPREQGNAVAFWRACLLTRLDQHAQAVIALHTALDEGHWFSEWQLRNDADLTPLQGRPDFEQAVALSLARHRAAQGMHKPALIVLSPKTGAAPHPLLLVLHGRSGSAQGEAPHWQLLTQHGWCVALAQSSQIFAPGQFCWDDAALAQHEVSGHVDALLASQPCDPARVTLAGFSQGAQLALRLASSGRVKARGVILVAPSIPNIDVLLAQANPDVLRALRVFILAGERDNAIESIHQIRSRLHECGTACEMLVLPHLSHDYPVPFEPVLMQAVQWVYGSPRNA
jgi:predicted esterase